MSQARPHVTTILSLLAKPDLIPWAAGLSAEYMKANVKTADDLMTIDEIAKEAKGQWKKVRDEAGDRGKRVHAAIEKFLNSQEGTAIEVDKDIEQPFKAFLRWWNENDIEVVETECSVWSNDGGGYKGTFDLTCFNNKVKKTLYLIDIKTSPRIYDEVPMQLAAYFYSWKQRSNFIPERAAVLRLDYSGKYEFFEILESEVYEHYQAFLKLVEFWHLTH